MGKILVAYATMAGSTAEVAQAIRDELAKSGAQVDVLLVAQVKDITPYDGVVLGGPMIMGWHRAALGFLHKHRKDLRRNPVDSHGNRLSAASTRAATEPFQHTQAPLWRWVTS